jgi:hypothetical protein
MAFELGQAVMLRALRRHDVHVFESTPHRLALSLSDLGGIDPLIHGDNPAAVSRRLLGAFAPANRSTSLVNLETLRLELARVVRRYKRQYATETIFEADGFRILTAAASDHAAHLGLIAR